MNVLSQGFNKVTGYYAEKGIAQHKTSEDAAFIIHYEKPTKTIKYNIISTDYDQYSMIYSCDYVPIVGIRFEHIWFLSRNKTLPDSIVDKLKKILKEKHIESTDINSISQNC